jgi:hypothetical protein
MAGQNRRTIVLGVVGALVLAFALWHFVLDSGGGSNSATSTTLPGIAATTPLPSTTTAASGGSAGAGSGVSVDIVTNPFLPKYVAPASDTTGANVGTTTGGATTGGTTATTAFNPGTVPTGTTFTPAVTSPPNVSGAPASGLPTSLDKSIKTIKAVTVQLVSIQTPFGVPTAGVKLGDKTDSVMVGQTFETSYRLLSLTDRCGTFVYGDSPFQVCVGETAVK